MTLDWLFEFVEATATDFGIPGQRELETPVRQYVPQLRLKDEQAAAQMTVLNLLNQTAGLD